MQDKKGTFQIVMIAFAQDVELQRLARMAKRPGRTLAPEQACMFFPRANAIIHPL